MSDTKDIIYSFSNNDNIGTIEKISNALYSRANDYINSRKQVVAKGIFDDNLDENPPA
jgi:hypothetical protein